MISTPAVLTDCFGCFPGGYGNPVICEFGEHFDQTGTAEYFGPRSQMHGGCTAEQCSTHGECNPSEETIDTFLTAVNASDIDGLVRMLHAERHVRLDRGRQAIQLLSCNGRVLANIALDRRRFSQLMMASFIQHAGLALM